MLRDNLAGLIEPMLSSAGAYPLALCTARKKPSDDRSPCLENPRPEGAESTLTENAASPFHAEPKQKVAPYNTAGNPELLKILDKVLDGTPKVQVSDVITSTSHKAAAIVARLRRCLSIARGGYLRHPFSVRKIRSLGRAPDTKNPSRHHPDR